MNIRYAVGALLGRCGFLTMGAMLYTLYAKKIEIMEKNVTDSCVNYV